MPLAGDNRIAGEKAYSQNKHLIYLVGVALARGTSPSSVVCYPTRYRRLWQGSPAFACEKYKKGGGAHLETQSVPERWNSNTYPGSNMLSVHIPVS